MLGLLTAWDAWSFYILATCTRALVDSKATLEIDASRFVIALPLFIDRHGPSNASRYHSRIIIQLLEGKSNISVGILVCRDMIVIRERFLISGSKATARVYTFMYISAGF